MNPTLATMLVATEQLLRQSQAERGWQRKHAVEQRTRRHSDVLATLQQRLHVLVRPRPRGTLAFVMPAVPRG